MRGAARYSLGVSTRAAGRHRRTSGHADRPSTKPAFELSEAKLRAPTARPGVVPRTALVDRLTVAHAPPAQLGSLPRQAEDLRGMLDTIGGGAPGASSLTTAELRLLPLLQTHLTFREIGERLYVSRHTVKTQAISVYRKLGVSSRSEAIARMHELGLLAHA